MAVLPYVISEVFSEGEVPEQFYDDKNFPLDRDHRGEVWILKSTADCLGLRYYIILLLLRKRMMTLDCA